LSKGKENYSDPYAIKQILQTGDMIQVLTLPPRKTNQGSEYIGFDISTYVLFMNEDN